MQGTEELARWPSRGNRRRLEAKWLVQLEQRGLEAFLPKPPADIPPQLFKAVEQFNRREFWDCHETLEEVWLKTPYPLRFFYHSIIKTAVGLHHASRHNQHGARVKLDDGVRLLGLFQPAYMGVRTDRLLAEASEWLAWVNTKGPVDWSTLDTMPTPIIQTTGTHAPSEADSR